MKNVRLMLGDEEYPASGWVRIGKEVMEFTRASDVLTITRAQYGTDAKAHSEGDNVQLCLVYESAAPADILYDMLNVYSAVVLQNLSSSSPRSYTSGTWQVARVLKQGDVDTLLTAVPYVGA